MAIRLLKGTLCLQAIPNYQPGKLQLGFWFPPSAL